MYVQGRPPLGWHGIIKSTPLEGLAVPPPWLWCSLGNLCFVWFLTRDSSVGLVIPMLLSRLAPYLLGSTSPQMTLGGWIRVAWEACPVGCKLIILGDLNTNFGFPWDEQEKIIVNLLDKINLVDTSHSFECQQPCRSATSA